MLVEQRTYTTHPGKLQEYLALYEQEGLAIQRPILGRMVGYYRTEHGPLNQVVHMWGYLSHAEREQRRALLAEQPRWVDYLGKMMPLLQAMESRILVPAPFFQPRWDGGA
jgi:hypothetical protein